MNREQKLEAALREVMEWLNNWQPPFLDDDAWLATEQRIQDALSDE